MNPNLYYSNFLLSFPHPQPPSTLSTITTSSPLTLSPSQHRLRNISSILDLKFLPSVTLQPNCFLSRAQLVINNTKKQVMVLLNSNLETDGDGMKKICEALSDLGGGVVEVLESKAVRCYEKVVEIQGEREKEVKGNRGFRALKKVLQELVRFSIIYNQYKKRNGQVRSETEIGIESNSGSQSQSESDNDEDGQDSEESNNSIDKIYQQQFHPQSLLLTNNLTPNHYFLIQQIDQKLIKSIQIQVFKKQFYDLILEYLANERLKLNEIKQICRICQKQVQISQMTVHLQGCQRKHYTLQELQLNRNKLVKLKQKINKLMEQEGGRREVLELVYEEIERICSSGSEIGMDVFGEKVGIEDFDGEYEKEAVVLQYKKLIEERSVLMFKFKPKELVLKTQISGFLGVDSVIRENKKQQTTEQQKKPKQKDKQVSWVKQNNNSTISIESNHIQNRSNKKSIYAPIPLQKTQSGKQTRKTITIKPILRSKKSIHWQQKARAINTKKSLKNFELLKFLGKGAFGKVYLVRDNITHDYYAVKCIKMDKKLLQDQKNIQNLKNQHDIFRKISGEFLVKAAFSFSQGNMHMFFLQYMPGGDFAALLEEEVYLEQDVAKFYLAEIVLAIEHLHNMNIIHRDLKPANLVFDEKGHLKLTDFGLSKEGITKKLLITKQQSSSQVRQQDCIIQNIQISKIKSVSKSNPGLSKRKTLVKRSNKQSSNKSIVGTPDYIAPQVLSGISTENSSIDWWSFGVIVYEALIGVRPFGAMTIDKIYTNIRNMAIEWPPTGHDQGCITPQAKDLIQSLLTINFYKRLGAETISQIKSHPFFSGICWQTLKSQTPPLAPNIKNDFNLFQDAFLRKQIQDQMNEIQSTIHLNHKIELDDYMRIDLLSETTERAFKEVVMIKLCRD